MSVPSPSGFHGRTQELAWLRGLWDACTARGADGRFEGGPRMAVIAAETGVGKSRLVQALYQQLTQDPYWDPAEVNYWPDAFQRPGEQIRVNPHTEGHVPGGPPRFLWLGMRWQPTDSRNVEERGCRLPEARDALQLHVEIADRYRSIWERAQSAAGRAIRQQSIGELVAHGIVDAAIPLGGGLAFRLLKGAVGMARDARDGARDATGAQQRQHQDAAEEMVADLREVFGGTGSAGRVLPTVLWLDDAQWIDATTLRFLERLWSEARANKWPLLVLVTHWEREWLELRAARGGDAPRSLAHLDGEPGVEVRMLRPAAREELAALLRESLPGLRPAQVDLMMEKASGNFLAMVENVGELLANPDAFEEGDHARPLTQAGELFVREWESDRQKRIEQRFSRLGREVKMLLGWGSELGIRFLTDVVADYATRVRPGMPVATALDSCVTPYAILGTPSPKVREFRDRAFHVVARKHFERWSASEREALHDVLRAHLVRWVNGSFDAEGCVLRREDDEDWSPPEESAIFLDPEERRDLLGMAVRELPMPAHPDWEDPVHAAALRARVLASWTDEIDRLYDRVRGAARALADVRWEDVPPAVLSDEDLGTCVTDWLVAHATATAQRAALGLVARLRRRHAASPTPELTLQLSETLRKAADGLDDLGEHEQALGWATEALGLAEGLGDDGDRGELELQRTLALVGAIETNLERHRDALGRFEASLAIARRRAARDPDDRNLLSVVTALNRTADALKALGHDDQALARHREALAIIRPLERRTGKASHRRTLSVTLDEIAGIEFGSSDTESALRLYRESLEITRSLAEEDGSPQAVRDLTVSLDKVATVEHAAGNGEHAAELAEEALGLCMVLLDDLDSPENRRDVVIALGRLADIERSIGRSEEALGHFLRSVEMAREVVARRGTTRYRRDLVVALMGTATMEEDLDREADAVAHLQEALAIVRDAPRFEGAAISDDHLLFCLLRIVVLLADLGRATDALPYLDEWLAAETAIADAAAGPRESEYPYGAARIAGAMLEESPARAVELATDALRFLDEASPAVTDPATRSYTAALLLHAILASAWIDLGDHASARPHAKRALALARCMDGVAEDDRSRNDVLGAALAWTACASILRTAGDEPGADRAARAAARWERFLESRWGDG